MIFPELRHNYTVFNLGPPFLNGIDLKFVSHGLWSEKQNILRQHMYKNEFWILTIKCGNKLKHENEAEGPWPLIYWSKSKILFYACVEEEGWSAPQAITREKQT
jgi:hypothetical protein